MWAWGINYGGADGTPDWKGAGCSVAAAASRASIAARGFGAGVAADVGAWSWGIGRSLRGDWIFVYAPRLGRTSSALFGLVSLRGLLP